MSNSKQTEFHDRLVEFVREIVVAHGKDFSDPDGEYPHDGSDAIDWLGAIVDDAEKLLTEMEQTIPDPHIAMRRVKVMFGESKYDYETDINGTRREITAYFRFAPLNVSGSDDPEVIRSPVRLEFLPVDEGGETIAVDLRK